MTVDVLKLGRFIFERQARDFGDPEVVIDANWQTNPALRAFYAQEAAAILSFQGFTEKVDD